MKLKLRLIVPTVAETAVFVRDFEVEKRPHIGDDVDVSPMCGPFIIQEMRTKPDGTIVCDVMDWEQIDDGYLGLDMGVMKGDIFLYTEGGFVFEETYPTHDVREIVAKLRCNSPDPA